MVLTVMKTMTLGTNRNLLHFHSLSSLFPFIHTQKEEKKASNVICIYTFWSTQKYTVPRVLYMKKSIKKKLAVADLPLPLSSLSLSLACICMYIGVYIYAHYKLWANYQLGHPTLKRLDQVITFLIFQFKSLPQLETTWGFACMDVKVKLLELGTHDFHLKVEKHDGFTSGTCSSLVLVFHSVKNRSNWNFFYILYMLDLYVISLATKGEIIIDVYAN